MNRVKKIAFLAMIAGVVLLSYGFMQIIHTERAQQSSLAEAHSLLNGEKTAETKDNGQTQEQETDDGANYLPDQGETAGILSIPKIDAELPIVEGTDPDDLEKGVGHYKGTAYPTENDQIVLSGHRDTVFRRMGEVEIGDIFIVKLPYGEFRYQMESARVVDADDRTVIKPTAPEEVLTLTTCYPFSYLGNAPQRYIITAVPVE
ncbi:class D sortase [Sediminibacillus dalangtanensis]|uniref:Class D sortase n=1 Tax=Sediminibacillus dalangtanensis TaxID=2729421 RepID=A0ABX7VTX0_9BACI|nr:class D sortase [Sediminibacillus dalangtanensis]QTN00413.1 class D sortase [Sediminibacillus dalangtanensis]